MNIGYARTSTVEQGASFEAQQAQLKAAGCEKVFCEQVSAVAPEREELESALEYAREGDVLVVTKLDRLARSVPHLCEIGKRLDAKGVGLKVLDQAIDTTTPTGRLMFNMLGAIAQFERELINTTGVSCRSCSVSRSTRRSVSWIMTVFLQRDVLRGERKAEIRQPPPIRSGPAGAARIAPALPEQKRFQAMFCLRAQADGIFARPDEIAQGFIVGGRDIDRRQLPCAMQAGERVAIAPVSLDPIATAFWHARGIHHDAVFSLGGQIPVDPEPARARLVHEAQPPMRRPQRPHQLGDGLHIAADDPIAANLLVTSLLGERDVDRFLVDIHPYEHATFRHGVPPLCVGRRGTLIGVAQPTSMT